MPSHEIPALTGRGYNPWREPGDLRPVVRSESWARCATPTRSRCRTQSVERRKSGAISDQLLIVEHPHVVTMGRNGHHGKSAGCAGTAGARRHRISSTPIAAATSPITVRARSSAIRSSICENGSATCVAYVRASKQVMIDALAGFGIRVRREAGATGVWTERGQNRGDRRAHQPLGHFPRLRAERGYGFELFPVHRTVRFDQDRSPRCEALGCRGASAGKWSRHSIPNFRTQVFDRAEWRPYD